MSYPVIVAFARTPIGSLSGALKQVSAPRLGAAALMGVMAKVPEVSSSQVGEVFMGNVLSAGVGQAPATQAVRFAGLGDAIPSTTINKVCASGMKSVFFGAQAVDLGLHEVVLAGGMESMSNAPHLLAARKGIRLGDATLIDSLVHDGLWDPYDKKHMGACAEVLAEEMNITRNEQDDYAQLSYDRAIFGKALHEKHEIVSVENGDARKKIIVSDDEEPKNGDTSKLRSLRTIFKKDGNVTAGNASTINDGAAALMITSRTFAEQNNLTPLCEIIAFADAQTDPTHFTMAPVLAIPKALALCDLEISDVDVFEISEAFSLVAIANAKILSIPTHNLNIHGGAVALGHPIGASGARIIGTLAAALANGFGQIGVAAVCNGGGGASAIVLRKTP